MEWKKLWKKEKKIENIHHLEHGIYTSPIERKARASNVGGLVPVSPNESLKKTLKDRKIR